MGGMYSSDLSCTVKICILICKTSEVPKTITLTQRSHFSIEVLPTAHMFLLVTRIDIQESWCLAKAKLKETCNTKAANPLGPGVGVQGQIDWFRMEYDWFICRHIPSGKRLHSY